jgi:hypothetical protein
MLSHANGCAAVFPSARHWRARYDFIFWKGGAGLASPPPGRRPQASGSSSVSSGRKFGANPKALSDAMVAI